MHRILYAHIAHTYIHTSNMKEITTKKYREMSKKCEITGKKVIVGNNVSHSRIHTKRTFAPNLQTKKFYIPEEDMWITLKVSAKGMRYMNKNGVWNAIIEADKKGVL